MNVSWKNVEKTLLGRGALILAVALICFAVIGFGQQQQPVINIQTPAPPAGAAPFLTSTTQDPWFWIMVGAWFLSSLVSGMPEPAKGDSPGYIWMYRSLHIIVASGTSYFQHPSMWLSDEQMKSITATAVAAGSVTTRTATTETTTRQ